MTLNSQGLKIAAAIEAGLAAMTRERWSEIRAAEKHAEEIGDTGTCPEWEAPEFSTAREATMIDALRGWDFDGWQNTLGYLRQGVLAGHSFAIEIEREEDGRFLAAVPELPGVMAYGDTEAEAVDAVRKIESEVRDAA